MGNPVRVLQVMGILDRGGAESMIMNIYRQIDRSKIQFDFVVHQSKEGVYDREVRKLGGRIFIAPTYTGKNHFKYKKWWNAFFQEHQEYKIVHSHIRSTASIVLGIAKQYDRITIAHSHNTSSGKGISALAKNILQYGIRRNADYFFGCSQAAGEWLFGKKICASDRYFNLKNAVDTEKFVYDIETAEKHRKEFDVKEGEFLIGTVGRFIPQKNPYKIIDIIATLKKRNFPFKFIWVGTGEMIDEIKSRIEQDSLNDIIILTGVRDDVNELMMAMDLFLFPSKWEGLPVVVIEAQAAGLRCVISDTITSEVCITPLIRQVSVDAPSDEWCSVIDENITTDHVKTIRMIEKSGYDIRTSSDWITDFYMSSLK